MGNSSSCDNLVGGPYATNQFNLSTNANANYNAGNNVWKTAPSIIHCHNPGQRDVQDVFNQQVYGQAWKPYPYIDGNSSVCVWKTDQEAYGCCTFPVANGQLPSNFEDLCGNFLPSSKTGTSLCQPLMLNICENNWDSPSCKPYLDAWKLNSDVGPVVQMTIANYINNIADRNPCVYENGSPGTNDYTSPSIGRSCKRKDGTLRDDSKDDFINDTLIKLCTIDDGGTGESRGGICDNILQQYCAQFTRNDLDQDAILRKICGCHLPVPSQTIDTTCDNASAPQTCLKYETDQFPQGISRKVQNNQYPYPATPVQCDPICNYGGTIQKGGDPCTQTVCIMDNVDVSLLNSACDGNVTIAQVCGPSAGTKTGNCYMNEVDVSLINSTCGGVFLNQQCNACFTFPPDKPWEATQVPCCDPGNTNGGKCGGGAPSRGGGTSTSPDQRSTFFNWIKNHPFTVFGGIAMLIFILFLVLIFLVRE